MILVALLCVDGETKAPSLSSSGFPEMWGTPSPGSSPTSQHPQLQGLFLISYVIQMEKRSKAAPTVDRCEAAIQGPGFLTKR